MPLYGLPARCEDPRYPALAGPFVLGCTRGDVDVAWDIQAGRLIELPLTHRSPGIGPGVVYIPGMQGGLIRLEDGAARVDADASRFHRQPVAPTATDGRHLAVLEADRVQAYPIADRTRSTHTARPMGWYAPAMSWPWIAWVEDGGDGDPDIWWLRAGERPAPLADGPEAQTHVAGDAGWLAWVEPGRVVRLHLDSGARLEISADTGFSGGLALGDGEVCWEDRAGTDIDIRCSDDRSVRRTGHQQWPSRSGPYLLFREEGRAWLQTAEEPPSAPLE